MVGHNRNLAQEVEYVTHCAKELGILSMPGNRLERMRRVLIGPDGTPQFVSPDHPEFEIALEAVRDVQQLGLIFDQLNQTGAKMPANYRNRVRELLLRDTVLPQDDLTDSPGRDIQCELFVFAACSKAGLGPEFAEPDVCCTYQAIKFALAVKRVKSQAKLEERVIEGVDQIRRAGLPGIVYADISVMRNRKNEPEIRDVPVGVLNLRWQQDTRQFFEPYRKSLEGFFRGTQARGLILTQHNLHHQQTDGWGLWTGTMAVTYSEFNQRRNREFHEIWAKLSSVLPNLEISDL